MKKTLLVTKPDYFNPLHIARMHHLQYAQCTPHSMDHKTMWQINFQIFLLRFPTKCWIFDQTVAWAMQWAAGTRHTASDWDWQASWHSALQQTQRLNVGEQDTLSIGLLSQRSLGSAVSISTTLATMECPLSSIPTFLHRLRAWWLSLSRSRYLNFEVILIVFVLPKPSFSVGLELFSNRIYSRQLHQLLQKHP